MSKIQMLPGVLGWCVLTVGGLAMVLNFDSRMAPAVLVTGNVLIALVLGLVLRKSTESESKAVESVAGSHLHWNPDIQRRGMGDLIRSVNHIAIIVSDVGRSLAFYTEIMGFQQIQRPNFDRHGAWLTMGNLELHLIKGVPNAPTGQDLIVSHIALETDYPEKVLEKLLEFEVPFRQNISVPDPKKARENLVEAFETSEGKITQYFVRDPDGYYLELCNCDILTAFCLFKEKNAAAKQKAGHVPKYMQLMDAVLGSYNESGQVAPSTFRLPQLFKTSFMAHRWVKKARQELSKNFEQRVEAALAEVKEASQPDPEILAKFTGRQKTYCDVCQGFSQEDLVSALCRSGNHAPTALLLLASCRQDVKVYLPPQYLLSEGGRIQQQVMAVSAPTKKGFGTFGSFSIFASKPFEDAEPPSRTSQRRQSGQMLALTFENDPNMQDYLTRSSTFARNKGEVPDLEAGPDGLEVYGF
eukprot:Skav203298  [mRNA]  locus=scaffold2189:91108:92517:+ [translate_table: standard]